MKQLTITPEQFQQAKEVNRLLIESIFQKEESFKKKFIIPYRAWELGDYSIYNVQLSGYRAKVVLEFYDGGTHEVVLELDDVYRWFLAEAPSKEESNK